MSAQTIVKDMSERDEYFAGSLCFPSNWHDSTRYYDTTKLRKKYNFKPRSKVEVLVEVFDSDKDMFEAEVNYDNAQKTWTCAHEFDEGAEFRVYNFGDKKMGFWERNYPKGRVMIFGTKKVE